MKNLLGTHTKEGVTNEYSTPVDCMKRLKFRKKQAKKPEDKVQNTTVDPRASTSKKAGDTEVAEDIQEGDTEELPTQSRISPLKRYTGYQQKEDAMEEEKPRTPICTEATSRFSVSNEQEQIVNLNSENKGDCHRAKNKQKHNATNNKEDQDQITLSQVNRAIASAINNKSETSTLEYTNNYVNKSDAEWIMAKTRKTKRHDSLNKNKRPTPAIGINENKTNLKVVEFANKKQDPLSWIFVTGFDPKTKEHDILEFLKDNNLNEGCRCFKMITTKDNIKTNNG
ncbi:unnamed protein product [Ceutorhynchus assimilis]|uniref:Uncharacterized protein n=1 Tax=Ceutorhynchus assimilis TaxID=467358 RepID=A0A9N9MGV5_9CUCU|nr:unnamed protein product [Ceutorhynchus assimilis]